MNAVFNLNGNLSDPAKLINSFTGSGGKLYLENPVSFAIYGKRFTGRSSKIFFGIFVCPVI
jgi:hypothetical protein